MLFRHLIRTFLNNTNHLVTSVVSAIDCEEYSILYGYNNRRLSSITHNGFNYEFTYDNMGRSKDVRIAGAMYSSTSYDTSDEIIITTSYATGEKIKQEHDDFDRPIKKTYIDECGVETVISKNEYDSLDWVTKSVDNTTENEYNYKYDGFSNLSK